MLEGILAGTRVLDLTQNVAGPFCSQTLGDLGAEVIKIERPVGGDDSRAWRSPQPDSLSAHFIALNRNKKSVCVDLASAQGREVVQRLAAGCDVLLHSMKPASAEACGLGWDTLSPVNPRLVYCAVSAYGEAGPLRELPGYDPVVQAFSGMMSLCGHPQDEPSRVPVSIIDAGTGMWAAIGILAACLARTRTGRGTRVQVSLLETSLSWMGALLTAQALTGAAPQRIGSALSNAAPYELFRTRDGHVMLAAPNDRLFVAACRALSLDELAQDPRFRTNALRLEHRSRLHALIEERTATLEAAAVVGTLRAAGVPCGELNTLPQALAHPQVQAVEMLGAWSQPCTLPPLVELPLRMDGRRSNARSVPPALGEHTDTILAGAGYSESEIADLRKGGVIA